MGHIERVCGPFLGPLGPHLSTPVQWRCKVPLTCPVWGVASPLLPDSAWEQQFTTNRSHTSWLLTGEAALITIIPRKCCSCRFSLLATVAASLRAYTLAYIEESVVSMVLMASFFWQVCTDFSLEVFNFLQWFWPCDFGRLGQPEHVIFPWSYCFRNEDETCSGQWNVKEFLLENYGKVIYLFLARN